MSIETYSQHQRENDQSLQLKRDCWLALSVHESSFFTCIALRLRDGDRTSRNRQGRGSRPAHQPFRGPPARLLFISTNARSASLERLIIATTSCPVSPDCSPRVAIKSLYASRSQCTSAGSSTEILTGLSSGSAEILSFMFPGTIDRDMAGEQDRD
jgi:hypothetical protein